MGSSRTFDHREAGRFLVSGAVATLGNMAAVWLARPALDFRPALLCGIAAGMTISFLLSKFYAFRSPDLARTGGELVRFALVYGLGLLVYLGTALAGSAALAGLGIAPRLAELGGVLAGAAAMAVSGYLGHRWFTYAAQRGGQR
jgi:putative flippase GtrA